MWEYPRLPLSERTFIIGKGRFFKKAGKAGCPCKSKHNTVDAGEINDFFVGDNLTPEQMDQIYSYLENRNIDVVPVLDEAMLMQILPWMILILILTWMMTAL